MKAVLKGGENNVVTSENFNSKADIYDKYRPSYSDRYAQFLSSIGIGKSSCVADVGAGTGKHASILVDLSQEVYCVEPNEEMLSVCRKKLGSFQNAQFILSSAEEMQIPTKSVDFISVAQAFHLIDGEKCRKEFSRVLKHDGKVILTWQSKDHQTRLFQETEKVLHEFCPNYQRDIHAPQLTPYSYKDFFRGGSYDFYYFHEDHHEDLDEETFIGRTLSASYSPTQDAPQYRKYLNALRALFHNYCSNGVISTALSTVIYVGNF